MRYKSQKVEVLILNSRLEVMCSYVQSRAVTCNAAEDVERGGYPNLSKNTIKIKCSSVLFNSFINTIGWSSSLLFSRLSRLDCWSSPRWYSVNSRWSRCWLVKMILVKQVHKLPKVLNCWSWLSGIFFFRRFFQCNQIIKSW